MNELVQFEFIINGQKSEATMIIVDSKSIENTVTVDEKGYDAGEKF